LSRSDLFDEVADEDGYLTGLLHCKDDASPNRAATWDPLENLSCGAVSIGANLAKGSARKSDKDFARFVMIAFGSASELEQHLLLVVDLAYVAKDQHVTLDADVTEIKRMLAGLNRRLMADGRKPTAR